MFQYHLTPITPCVVHSVRAVVKSRIPNLGKLSDISEYVKSAVRSADTRRLVGSSGAGEEEGVQPP